MKTAMQELLDKFEEVKYLDNMVQLMILRGELQKLFQKEKQQIIDAANHGVNFDKSPYKNSEDYYNETFTEL